MEIGASRLSFAKDCKGFATGLVAFDEDSQRISVVDLVVDSVLDSVVDSALDSAVNSVPEFIRLTSLE